MNFSDLNFETLQDIPPLLHYYDVPHVSVTGKGLFSLNGALRKKVGEQREFRVKISPDGRYLVLYLQEPPNIRISAKSVNVTHTALAQSLEEKGILLPAVYTMEWCQERCAWIGCCQELPQPPALSELMPGKKAVKKAAGGKK